MLKKGQDVRIKTNNIVGKIGDIYLDGEISRYKVGYKVFNGQYIEEYGTWYLEGELEGDYGN